MTTTMTSDLNRRPRGSAATAPARWWWLLGAAALLPVADGRTTIALAAWLAPALLLRYVREERAGWGLAVAWGLLTLAHGIGFRGMIPIPGIAYYIFLPVSGLMATLPYAADRFWTPRLPGWAATLVFPCALAAEQFAYGFGPQGTWGAVAYSQAGDLPLLQILSVTGLAGIAFLVGWVAAATNRGWEQRRLRPLAPALLALTAVVLAGGARLAFFPPQSATVRVAGLSPFDSTRQASPTLPDGILAGTATPAQVATFRAGSLAAGDALLQRSAQQAAAGARIVFWSETADYVLAADEPSLLARGEALARADHIYLGMALGAWTPGAARPLRNELVLITPAGQIGWQYLKAHPTPGPEAAVAARPDGRLRELDTPWGRIAGAICYDMDFPRLLAQAGRGRADLVLSPAGDWPAIDPRHTEMAGFRAIEQGFNLVRQSHDGRSAAYDYEGRLLGQMDQFHAQDLALVAEVPTRGVATVYAWLGDGFAWLCLAGIVALGVAAMRRRPGGGRFPK